MILKRTHGKADIPVLLLRWNSLNGKSKRYQIFVRISWQTSRYVYL